MRQPRGTDDARDCHRCLITRSVGSSLSRACRVNHTALLPRTGSIIYQSERVVKAVWSRLCFWCCFRCCWERHYGGSAHQAARAHAGKEDDDLSDSEVSKYEGEEDRWGAVEFDDDESGMNSEFTEDESYDEELDSDPRHEV